MMKTLSIIIPIYNEKETLRDLLRRVEESPSLGLHKEIILVDDFSTDGTREILTDLAKTGKYKIFFQNKNLGKGSALRCGFSKATGDFILIQDADLEYDPKEYSNLVEPLVHGNADVVYGSRFLQNKPHGVLFFWHYIGNKLLTLFSNMLTGLYLTDMETCYKAFTKEALNKIIPDLTSRRFDIEPEITAVVAHRKLRVYEVSISYSSRTYDEGKKINWKDALTAVWTIVKSRFRFSSFGKDKFKSSLFFILIFLCGFSVYALRPAIAGDSLLYVHSIEVLKTGIQPAGFIPMMIVSTYLGLRLIMLLNLFTNSIAISWIFLDYVLYIITNIFFYSLLKRIFKDARVAFLGTLFLATNYAAVSFGLGYLMDMGGWAFYVASLYFSYRYLESGEEGDIWLYASSLLVGIGGLYKEYAFVAYVIIFGLIIWKNWKQWSTIFKKVFITGCLAFTPIILVNIYVYFNFNHYTYINWFFYQKRYAYQNKVVEFIKSFGSIYNFGWFLFVGGLSVLLRRSKQVVRDKDIVFIWLVILSAFSVLVWPVVTRVLFIAMPAAILVSCLCIQKIKNPMYVVIPILIVYTLSSFLMDAYILDFVNLHSFFPFL